MHVLGQVNSQIREVLLDHKEGAALRVTNRQELVATGNESKSVLYNQAKHSRDIDHRVTENLVQVIEKLSLILSELSENGEV